MDNLWIIYGYGWWLIITPLNNMSSSIGMMTFPIYNIYNLWKNHEKSSHHPAIKFFQKFLALTRAFGPPSGET